MWRGLNDTAIPAASIALPGWHAAEGSVRWTDGAAALDLLATDGEAVLDVRVSATLRYPPDQAKARTRDAA